MKIKCTECKHLTMHRRSGGIHNILLFRRCETSDKERSSETEERESGRTETAGGSVDDIHSLPHAAHHQV